MDWKDAPVVEGWKSAPPIEQGFRSAPRTTPLEKVKNWLLAPSESVATIVTGLAGSAVGGLAGMLVGAGNITGFNKRVFGVDINAAGVISDIQDQLTHKPSTEEAESMLGAINYPLEKWSQYVSKPGGELTQDVGAYPSVAAGIETALEFAPWMFIPAAYRKGRLPKKQMAQEFFDRETFDARLKQQGLSEKDIAEGRKSYLAEVDKADPLKTNDWDAVTKKSDELKAIVSPIGTGSPKAQAIVKNYTNSMALVDTQLGRQLKLLEDRFSRKDFEEMHNAASADELAFLEGREATAIDSLSLDKRNAVRALQSFHEGVASEAMQLGIIPASKEGYVPRVIIRELGADTAKNVYGPRAVKTATKHAKKRKYKTQEETEAAAIELLGKDAKISRDIRQYALLDAELQRAIHGKRLVQQIREYGTKIGEEVVKHKTPGKPTPGFSTIKHPAFVDVRPEIKARPKGDTGPMGGTKKVRKDEEGEIVWTRHDLEIRDDFIGPLKAALETTPNKVYQGIMKLKQAQMLAIMVSPMMHGMVIWGKALPFQPGRTLTFKNYFEGHRIENVSKDPAKRADNDAWVRDKSGGEFKDSEALLSQMILDGHRPIGNMGWYQRMTDIMHVPTLEAGRSVVSRIVGYPAKLFGKGAHEATLKAVDMAGQFWHDTLLWDQVRASGYGMYFDLRTKMIKQGIDKDLAGKTAAHLSNRFTGSIPFEDMSAGTRATMNAMLFSKSFTGTNIGLYTDALRGLPRAVQSQLIDSGATLQGLGKANGKLRQAAGAALVKDIAMMYMLNSMTQNAFKAWREMSAGGELDESVKGIVQEYENGWERYTDPATSVFDVDEMFVGGTNDPGKRQRVFIGTKPDGTAEYIRIPVGKVGEDLEKTLKDPVELAWNKLSPVMGWALGSALNDKTKQRDYDIEVYDQDGSTVGAAGQVVKYFLETSYAKDYAEAIVDAALGEDDAAWKALMITAGFSFSKGAPGGAIRGAMFKEEDRRRRAMRRVTPEARELIEKGKYEEAAQLMIGPGMMNPNEIQHWFENKLAPHVSERQIKEFMLSASELDKKRLEHQLELLHSPAE